jgi:pyridoxamine 5'-phosphate oxidase
MSDLLKDLRNDHHDFQDGSFEPPKSSEPWTPFHLWTKEAIAANVKEANAMSVSTVNASGQPSTRMVYLKDIIDNSLIFYSNFDSAKSADISVNNQCCLLFYWPEQSRQIKIYGKVSRLSANLSNEYFQSRPYESKIGAWASHQSAELKNKADLLQRVQDLKQQFPTDVPCPPNWGGFSIKPNYFEFWQGQPSRLHDRVVFDLRGGSWTKKRLNP